MLEFHSKLNQLLFVACDIQLHTHKFKQKDYISSSRIVMPNRDQNQDLTKIKVSRKVAEWKYAIH